MTTPRLPAAARAALAGLVLAACISDRPDATGLPAGDCTLQLGAADIGGVQAIIAIRDFAFLPDTIRIAAGTRVTWVNCEDASVADPHTATADGGAWESPLLRQGDVHSRVFDEPGAFPYHCAPHPFMRATILVE